MIIKALTKFLFMFASRLTAIYLSVITAPILYFLDQFKPNLYNYESYLYEFTNTKLIPGMAFAKEVFFNCTGYPRSLFNILIALVLARFTYHMLLLPTRFIIKMYYILRGHHIKS